ncbi:MAG: cyclic nucleotide-binding domain-containing protein [Bryobacteraceae bacterium]|jgi:CRP-like cAMP-binding protein
MIPDEFVKMTQTYRVLSELEPEQLRKLLPIAEDKQFRSGQVIFREGDQSSFFHLIVSGEVALEETAGSKPVLVQTLHPGEAMGWSALASDSRTHFQARALSPVSTIAFSSARIREACERDTGMGFALMKKLLDVVTERLDATRMQLAGRNGDLQSTQAN